ncbi:MAG: hypothetical protein AUI14_05225 [Actinobacteria bacterium 13_2_20CM_2_71_6]|nr:MAG: hypothetical protein AUI14_05225 [Actinobacteria bacterium 13_2_20CM_2_71_6]
MSPDSSVLAAARQAWHGAAELLLAGPQHRAHGTIRLRVADGGFATVAGPLMRVDVDELDVAGRRVRLAGTTYAAAGASVGIDVGAPVGVYHEGSGAQPDDPVDVDAAAAGYLAGCFALGDRALRTFAADLTPVLWPEHFDVGITADEVNYGVSLGDSAVAEPYAYVGPWKRRTGEFWNVPFGAAVPLREVAGTDGLVAFFAQGRSHAARDPLAA